MDNELNFRNFLSKIFGISIIFGSVAILVYAYVMRYMAVGISPLRSSFEKHPDSFDDTGKNLGLSNFNLFKKIHLPVNNTSIYIAFILCFVDIIKELPITLILRPFNFDTLAIRIYELASNEMLYKVGFPSLILVFTTAIAVMLLNSGFGKRKK